jgi:hypothetical protein
MMYIPQDFLELMDVVPECRKLRNVLEEIKNIAEQFDESNFENQAKLISEICDEALKNKPKMLSKTKSDLIEDYEYHIESILSGEFNEQFEV